MSHCRNKWGLVCSIFRPILLKKVLNSKKDKLILSQLMATIVDKVRCKGFPVLTAPTHMLGSSLKKADTGKSFPNLESLTLHIFDQIKVKQADIILD